MCFLGDEDATAASVYLVTVGDGDKVMSTQMVGNAGKVYNSKHDLWTFSMQGKCINPLTGDICVVLCKVVITLLDLTIQIKLFLLYLIQSIFFVYCLTNKFINRSRKY